MNVIFFCQIAETFCCIWHITYKRNCQVVFKNVGSKMMETEKDSFSICFYLVVLTILCLTDDSSLQTLRSVQVAQADATRWLKENGLAYNPSLVTCTVYF